MNPLNVTDGPSAADLFGAAPLPRRRKAADGAARKANGQFSAARRAGQLWQENALVELVKFIDLVKSRARMPVFTLEEFRVFCESRGMADPRSVNAWGAIPHAAVDRGLCEWTGQCTVATRAEAHGRLIKLWIAK